MAEKHGERGKGANGMNGPTPLSPSFLFRVANLISSFLLISAVLKVETLKRMQLGVISAVLTAA